MNRWPPPGTSFPLSADKQGRPNRVFLSYTREAFAQPASALAEQFARTGTVVWFPTTEPSVSAARSAVVASIRDAELFVALGGASGLGSPWLEFELQEMVQTCWRNPIARIALCVSPYTNVPPAFAALPFVGMFDSDRLQLASWREPEDASAFVNELMHWWVDERLPDHRKSIAEEEMRSWRDRVVHVGLSETSRALHRDPDETNRMRQSLEVRFGELQRAAVLRGDEARAQLAEEAVDAVSVARAIGDLEIAERYCTLALQLLEYSTPTPLTYSLVYNRGLFALGVGNYERAARDFDQAVEWSRDLFGRDHLSTLTATYNLAIARAQLHDLDMAADLLIGAREVALRTLGLRHPQTAAIAYNLGLIEARRDNREAAKLLLSEAAEAYEELRPPDSEELRAVRDHLAALQQP